MKKISLAFRTVFGGEATNQQFMIVFFTLLPPITLIILYFVYWI